VKGFTASDLDVQIMLTQCLFSFVYILLYRNLTYAVDQSTSKANSLSSTQQFFYVLRNQKAD
jgi:hypothetical protein